jgi:RHS repeat-associated protein
VPDQNPSGLGAFDLPLRLPGQRYDQETGLYYSYYRDYDPSLGRYGESDPIGLKGGLNTYAYGSGDPIRLTDRFGTTCATSPGTPDPCAYYTKRCADSGGRDVYYCKLAPVVCRGTPPIGGWTDCVRSCLQKADRDVCYTPDGKVDPSCTTGAHLDCWVRCAIGY